MQKKEPASDFRYATGKARVPWTAVGESVREEEIMAMMEFLIQPRPGKKAEYKDRLRRLRNELASLGEVSQPAGKLTLGGKVEELETRVAKMLGVKHAVFLNNATAGFEIALKFAGLQPGDVVTVKVLLRGKPIGGRRAVVALATAGPNAPDDPRLASKHWSIEAHPDPRTGEVSFPLLAAGEHLFSIKYFDETPGTYEGDLDEVSSFSHLRKGDKFEQTMFVSTYTCHVTDK